MIKNIKPKYYLLIITVLFVLCTGTPYESGTAWKNGRNLAFTVSNVRGDYSKTHYRTNTAEYYGTHDWVAERALKLVHDKHPENNFIEMLYLKVGDLKYYYLLGTEVPDTIREGTYQPVDTGLNIIYSSEFYRTHSITFKGAGGLMTGKTCANAARHAAERVSHYLSENNCRAAALFLGAITHYISDATFIPHLNDFDQGYAMEWKSTINSLTSRKLADEYYSDGQITTEDPFFYYDAAAYEFNTHSPSIEAYESVWYAGFDTYMGHSIGAPGCGFASENHKDFEWYSDHPQFPSSHFTSGPEKRADYWMDLTGQDNDFLAGIDHHINVAIYYSAAFINRAKNWYVKCAYAVEKELEQTITNMAFESLFLWMMIATGNAATLIALVSTLADKKELTLTPFQNKF